MRQKVYFVGTPEEVAHHAAPLEDRLSVSIATPSQVIESAVPGDLAVFYSEHFERFRQCVNRLKANGVATLYMIDGILEWRNAWENRDDEPACPWTMRPALSHKVACIGHSQMAMLDSWGNAGKTELVGVPRFDLLGQQTRRESSDGSTKVLVMSAKCPGFTPEQVDKTVKGFIDLKNWFASDANTKKIVPVWRLTGDLAERVGVENQCCDLTGKQLNEVLQSVDAVLTTPSTAMLESMLGELPVGIIDYNNAPHLVPAAWRITSNDQMKPVLDELADPPAAKMLYQQFLLQDALLPTDNATGRLVDLINRMLEHAKNHQGENPIEFPPNMLGEFSVELDSRINHARLYPGFAAFNNLDQVELQANLAHANREVEKLQNDLAQAKSELAQAHEIFEQIHQHPIAGPIVRLRQRFIDWMQRSRSRSKDSSQAVPASPSHPETKPTL